MRTRLCLVRHGETGWNVERRLQGHLDIALNARGREQALATADALSGHRFEAVYSSDLVRAKATAALA
ncbi:MAG: histidine phosphatase family protein, partial [Rhodocyclaceae bacterium]|nr:histidine phosphatase family protein [Rhodocyclaceae bacterium]